MNFKLAYIKLTVWYLAIVMLISLVFSFIVYSVSSQELNRGLRRQRDLFQNTSVDGFMMRFNSQLEDQRLAQLEESSNRLKLNLLYLNGVILVFAGAGSYYFARRTLEPIEEMAEMQSRFTADASHELRTPLTAMKTEIEVSLRDKKMTLEESKALLASNLEEVEKLRCLSEALLKLARFEGTPTKDSKAEVSAAAKEAMDKVGKIAAQKNIEISGETKPVWVSVEKHHLAELFTIILDNAVKYSSENKKVVVAMAESGKNVVITVTDEGVGIKASDLPHIFDRFYRADHSRSKNFVSGYGLGLSIAKQIVDGAKGHVEAESEPGKGTTFKITLPKAQ